MNFVAKRPSPTPGTDDFLISTLSRSPEAFRGKVAATSVGVIPDGGLASELVVVDAARPALPLTSAAGFER